MRTRRERVLRTGHIAFRHSLPYTVIPAKAGIHSGAPVPTMARKRPVSPDPQVPRPDREAGTYPPNPVLIRRSKALKRCSRCAHSVLKKRSNGAHSALMSAHCPRPALPPCRSTSEPHNGIPAQAEISPLRSPNERLSNYMTRARSADAPALLRWTEIKGAAPPRRERIERF